VIASKPNVPRAWSEGAVFVYADGRPELDDYLGCLRRAYPYGNPNERGQEQFSHAFSCGYRSK
jgi:hypothetical protein